MSKSFLNTFFKFYIMLFEFIEQTSVMYTLIFRLYVLEKTLKGILVVCDFKCLFVQQALEPKILNGFVFILF